MSRELDDLLSQPLVDVPDEGFSTRLLARISERNLRWARMEVTGWIVVALSLTGALAISRPGRELAAMALSLGLAAQIGVILTVVLLVFPLRETTE